MTQAPLIRYSRSASAPIDGVMVLLHGLGANGYDFADLIPAFTATSSFNLKVILPHAPVRPLTIAGGEAVPSWYDILAMAEHRIVNEDQVQHSVQMVGELLQSALTEVSASQLILAGFSQGGAIALESFLTLPQAVGGCLAMSTYTLHDPPPAAGHPNQQTPILMQHGSLDPVVKFSLGQRSAKSLQTAGFQLSWQEYPMQHQVCDAQILQIRDWVIARLSAAQNK